MDDEYVVKITFECDSEDYQQPNVTIKRVYIDKHCYNIPIPEPAEEFKAQGITKTNVLRVEVFKKVM